MNIVLVNESQGKSWIRTRRIMSRYCPQIGERTWAGHLSEEGLRNLRDDLKKVASKAVAVACHRVTSRSRLELEWIVGSSACFNEEGRYSFRQTALKIDSPLVLPKTAVERFAIAITKLSALFHDLGKASRAFQSKLAVGGGFEMIRHELVSFLILVESLVTDGVTDEQWLEELATNPAAACRCVTKKQLVPEQSVWLGRVLNRLDSDSGTLMTRSEIMALNDKTPGLLMTLWLVLSHHRKPDGDEVQYEGWDAKFHINKPNAEATRQPAHASQCLTPHPGEKPWENEKWLASVAATAKAALAAKKEMSEQQFTPPSTYFWANMASETLRPLLILSDHIASVSAVQGELRKKAFGKKNAPIYANLVKDIYAGDTLIEHLLKVAQNVRKFMALAWGNPAMPTTQLPRASIALAPNREEAFLWQNEIAPAIAQAKEQGEGVFTILAAETGSGKTIGSARVMHELNPKMRCTVALGLRTLTRQTGESMIRDMGIPMKDVQIVVGNPQTLGLADKAATSMENEATPTCGSESGAGGELDASMINTNCDIEWLQAYVPQSDIKRYWTPKHLAFNASPITVCTVDYLVTAVNLLKGGDAKLFLRLVSTDLVLDEIDAYSAQDLQSIGKVIYAVGACGHNVTLMSATLTPEIHEGLFNAWREGMAAFCARKAKSLAYSCVYLSNVIKPLVLNSPTLEQASNEWASYTLSIIAANDAKPNRARKIEVYSLKGNTRKACYEELITQVHKKHGHHHTVDKTGVRVSTGLIRFNSAKELWNYARYVATRAIAPGEPEIRLLPYHAKTNRATLGFTEALLSKLTNRKKEKDFLNTVYLRELLDSTTSEDVIILVPTTSIIETGQDRDFDWGIFEPSTVRAFIQGIGRVWRHRMHKIAMNANIIILDRTIRAAINSHMKKYWAKPGVEDSLPGLQVSEAIPAIIQQLLGVASLPAKPASTMPVRRIKGSATETSAALDMRLTANVLPIKQWDEALDARMCLLRNESYENNRIGYIESKVQSINLMGNGTENIKQGIAPPLSWYVNSFGGMNSKHAKKTPFRGHRSKQGIFIPSKTGVKFADMQTGDFRECFNAVCVNTGSARMLIHDIEFQVAKLMTGDKHINGASLSLWDGVEATKALTWDPHLGFLEEIYQDDFM